MIDTPPDIVELVLEPAVTDALTVEFIYDHPERGQELRRAIPHELLDGRYGAYLHAHDLDGWRAFTVARIVAAVIA